MSNDELELVPERNFWERTTLYSLIPRAIRHYFFEIKKKFGINVANIVYMAYKEWGKEVAVAIARRILEFNSYEELIKFLQERAKMLGEGRELVVNLIYSYQFTRELDKLIEERKNVMCPEASNKMTEVFQTFASHGVFYPVQCIRQVAEYLVGCRSTIQKRCRKTYEMYTILRGDKI